MKEISKAVAKKMISEAEVRRRFEAWFQAELTKSVEADKKTLESLD